MDIILNKSSLTPIYRQIYEQIIMQILSNEIPPHSILPSIRNIAKNLNISVISVKNAYEELERDGYIYTVPAKGCFISPKDSQTDITKKINDLANQITDFCKIYNVDPQQIFNALQKTSKNDSQNIKLEFEQNQQKRL